LEWSPEGAFIFYFRESMENTQILIMAWVDVANFCLPYPRHWVHLKSGKAGTSTKAPYQELLSHSKPRLWKEKRVLPKLVMGTECKSHITVTYSRATYDIKHFHIE
jgi:hypothetical protein